MKIYRILQKIFKFSNIVFMKIDDVNVFKINGDNFFVLQIGIIKCVVKSVGLGEDCPKPFSKSSKFLLCSNENYVVVTGKIVGGTVFPISQTLPFFLCSGNI